MVARSQTQLAGIWFLLASHWDKVSSTSHYRPWRSMCLPLAWTSLLPQPCLHNWHVLSQCGVSQHTWPVWCCTTLVGLCIGQLGQGRACLLTCLLDGCAEVCNVLMSVSTQTSGAAVAVAVEHHKLCRLAVPCKTWCVQLLRQLGMQGHLLQLQACKGVMVGILSCMILQPQHHARHLSCSTMQVDPCRCASQSGHARRLCPA